MADTRKHRLEGDAGATTFGVRESATTVSRPRHQGGSWPRRSTETALLSIVLATASPMTTAHAFDRFVFSGQTGSDTAQDLVVRVRAMARADAKKATYHVMHRVYDYLDQGDHATVDRIVALYEPADFPLEVSIGLLTVTLQASPRLRQRKRLVSAVTHLLRARGEDPDVVLRGLA